MVHQLLQTAPSSQRQREYTEDPISSAEARRADRHVFRHICDLQDALERGLLSSCPRRASVMAHAITDCTNSIYLESLRGGASENSLRYTPLLKTLLSAKRSILQCSQDSERLTRVCDKLPAHLQELLSAHFKDPVKGVTHSYCTEEYPHCHLPKSTEFDRLADINRSLTIDRSKGVPQKGFGRFVDANEMLNWCSRRGAYLIPLKLNQVTVGHGVLLTDESDFTEDARACLTALPEELKEHSSKRAWLEIAGVREDARKTFRHADQLAYDLVIEGVKDLAYELGITDIYGMVRGGKCANLAMPAHLARGFRDTGITVDFGDPYHVIRMNISDEIMLKKMIGDTSSNGRVTLPTIVRDAECKRPLVMMAA